MQPPPHSAFHVCALESIHHRLPHPATHALRYAKAYRDSLLPRASTAEANASRRLLISLLGLDRGAIPSETWQAAAPYRVKCR